MKTVKKRKSSKYVFTLKDVNIEEIHNKYGITILSNILQNEINQPNTTKLTELLVNPDKKHIETISFLDESKRSYKCNVSMIDFYSGKELENNQIKYNCYWCRHPFNTIPIGCPIKYVSSKLIKSYHSEANKDNYIIKENITKFKLNKCTLKQPNSQLPFVFTAIKNTNNSNSKFNIDKEEYYLTDCVCCSFNCVKAYINDNKTNILYSDSDSLLLKLYNEITNTKISYINPAPHWRLLTDYGGNLTIDEFRENFSKVSYEFYGIKTSLFRPISHLFEEKLMF